MNLTIQGAPSSNNVARITVPTVQIKASWSDNWGFDSQLQFIRAVRSVAGQTLGSCELRRHYGPDKKPWEIGFTNKQTTSLIRYWVRLILTDESGQNHVSWVGRISTESREVYGSDSAASGVQTFIAYEPLQILQKTHIGRSIWQENTVERDIGWLPAMNRRDDRNMLIGNRSEDEAGDGVYTYGGKSLWTRAQYLKYIIKRFVDQSDSDGPKWTVGGQLDAMESMTDSVEFGSRPDVANILRELIPLRLGLDYVIVPTDDGFEIRVYALSAIEASWGDTTLPKNPATVRLRASELIEVSVRIDRTEDNRYGEIRVVGDRVVVCGSLRKNDLVPLWDGGLETEYKNGDILNNASKLHSDLVRAQDIYRNVYQAYGAPTSWNMAGGAFAPKIEPGGKVSEETADFQSLVRSTLTWLPLLEGLDYSKDPAVDSNPADSRPDFMPPAVWVLDDQAGPPVFLPVDSVGIGVSVLQNEWGVLLSASPNHLLAANHFDGAESTQTEPEFDYVNLVATIAIETDQRLEISVKLPNASHSDGVFEIHVPGAELWVLARGTVVGMDSKGDLVNSGSMHRVLRNDTDRLSAVMAGAVARYFNDRARARVQIQALSPSAYLLGQILTVVEEAGASETIGSPITSVEWIGGDNPITIVRTGFAR